MLTKHPNRRVALVGLPGCFSGRNTISRSAAEMHTTMRRELTVGSGHAGGQLGWTHFGLGSARVAQVRVLWPGGQAGSWMQVSANQFVDIEQGATEARPWSPPKA